MTGTVVALWCVAAYLVGAVPTSHLVGRLHGVDLRRTGSGNLGATNVYRVIGVKAALLVVVTDLIKGFLPVWFFPAWDGSASPALIPAYGLLAILGHVRPVFTGFRGGKGVATAAGTLFAVAPVAALVGVLAWLGLVLLTRIASVASLAAASIVPLVAWLSEAARPTVGYAMALTAVVWWTHRANLGRLIRREELRLGAPGHADDGRPGAP